MAKEEIKKAKEQPKAAQKPNKFLQSIKKTGKFLKDCKGEIKKIVWPTPKTVFKNMGVVLVTVAVSGIFVFALDTIFLNLLSLIMTITH